MLIDDDADSSSACCSSLKKNALGDAGDDGEERSGADRRPAGILYICCACWCCGVAARRLLLRDSDRDEEPEDIDEAVEFGCERKGVGAGRSAVGGMFLSLLLLVEVCSTTSDYRGFADKGGVRV